jgi:hypothetical protein
MNMRRIMIALLLACVAIICAASLNPTNAQVYRGEDTPTKAPTTRDSSVSYRTLVEYYSPNIFQDVGCPFWDPIPYHMNYGDYITRIDYDHDYVGNNNWDNLGYPVRNFDLPAYVYYAVMETETHYFLWYALFHPADDFHCHTFPHENDLEGMVMCVLKDGSAYGDLRMVQLQAHNDFFQYVPPGETGIYENEPWIPGDDIDGTIQVSTTYPDPGVHPIVWVEGGGHGLRHEDTGDWPSVFYYYTGHAEDPDVVGYSHCGYDLLSISAEMWEQRTNCCGSGFLFDQKGDYSRWGFSVTGLGRYFDGDDGDTDNASPPWNWDDNDDTGNWLNGDWFMHPAGYHGLRFIWAEPFSLDYVYHPFGYDHLGGDVYNGNGEHHTGVYPGGTTVLRHGPYQVVSDVIVLSDQTLRIEPSREVRFDQGTRVIADGEMEADGTSGTIRFVSSDYRDTGIRLDGGLRVDNGGCIRFP